MLNSEMDWSNMVTDKKEGLMIDSRTSDHGLSMFRAYRNLPFNIKFITNTLCNAKYRQSYDINID